MNQKVPKKFEVLSQKMSSSQIRGIQQEQIFVEIAGKQGFLLHKRDKCRICLEDKFGIFHG